MNIEIPPGFMLGQIVATRNALESLDNQDMLVCLGRHSKGDWGDLCPEDKALNDLAVVDEGRILSSYKDKAGTKFWIITEWDRSVTTILLPEDY